LVFGCLVACIKCDWTVHWYYPVVWCFVFKFSDQLYDVSELKCTDHMTWMSMQLLEEKEHGIRIMTKNVSCFVRLIVKECINRNPVRVWSLIVRERLAVSNGFCMNLWVWNEYMSLKRMKAMFWLKIAT